MAEAEAEDAEEADDDREGLETDAATTRPLDEPEPELWSTGRAPLEGGAGGPLFGAPE